MKVFRYNAKKREDRVFNNTGSEKNPNKVSFFANNMDYAKKYADIYDNDGELIYTCELEVKEIEGVNLFNMADNYKSLQTYNDFIKSEIKGLKAHYTECLNRATTKNKKLFTNLLKNVESEAKDIENRLINQEFQSLSDYEVQNQLVTELKSLGFDGYTTKNEIALF